MSQKQWVRGSLVWALKRALGAHARIRKGERYRQETKWKRTTTEIDSLCPTASASRHDSFELALQSPRRRPGGEKVTLGRTGTQNKCCCCLPSKRASTVVYSGYMRACQYLARFGRYYGRRMYAEEGSVWSGIKRGEMGCQRNGDVGGVRMWGVRLRVETE
ncbi:hypothetical protein BJV78DRAFT_1184536 [Lactifluus subvellereus]|nr:hypothetical protein BJV78DRAFT_1184536 [Lactifluus subvellereus]